MEAKQKLNFNEIQNCKKWLQEFTESSPKWSMQNSYFYKHAVERWCKSYISNDAFIQAASEMYPSRLENFSKINYLFMFAIKSNITLI